MLVGDWLSKLAPSIQEIPTKEAGDKQISRAKIQYIQRTTKQSGCIG